MTGNSEYISPEQKKNARIEYLENLAKWHLFSLELLASLGELHHSAGQDRNPDKVLQITNEHLIKILKFDAVAFYLVDEQDSEFLLKYIWPEEYRATIQKEVDGRIVDGSFAWAVNQNRPVVVKSNTDGLSLVLHVLSTKQRVRGMFAGLISEAPPHWEETLKYTLSIILQNTANALESVALYNLFQETKSHLESKVHERTSDLEDHMVKMKEEIAYRKLAEESLWVARQEAESALKAKNELLTQFSHELKTPINSILACGEIIRSEIEKSGITGLAENFGVMDSTGRHLLKLIDDVQGLVQFNSPSTDIQPEAFLISNMLEGVSATLYPLARKNRNEIEVKACADLGSMISDESRVRQILLNIAGNACKFTQTGKILIESFVEQKNGGDWVCFRISDTGVGMNPEQVRQIFRETKTGNSGLRKERAAGMGLIFSKRLCHLLGGNIQVKSEPGKGSVFTLLLPKVKENSSDFQEAISKRSKSAKFFQKQNVFTETKANTAPGLKSSEPMKNDSKKSSGNINIWVVDEDRANGKILCHILEGQGWNAQPLDSTPSALKGQESHAPDLVIVGLGASKKKGLAFISEFVKNEPGKSIPILVFAAKEIAGNEKDLLPEQVQGVLQKGNCTRKDLIDHIKKVLKLETPG